MRNRYLLTTLLVLSVAAFAGGCNLGSETEVTNEGPGTTDSDDGGPGTNGPGTNGPGTNGPGTNGPGTNGPGTNGPGAGTVEPWKDKDEDSVLDGFDNCPSVSNNDQLDTDGDGVGDACDNCPGVPNADQANVCDPKKDDFDKNKSNIVIKYENLDSDGDGIPDKEDNCKNLDTKNKDDRDGDGVGDACDNCPDVYNPYQNDSDGNGTGDACEPDPAGPSCKTGGQNDCDSIQPGLTCEAEQKVCVCDDKAAKVEILKPNIMLLLDRSGSMGTTKNATMKTALDTLIDSSASSVNYGVTFFGESHYTYRNVAIVGSKTPSELKKIWASLKGQSGTPTAEGIRGVVDNVATNGLGGRGKRTRAIILLTDGSPNNGPEAIKASGEAYAAGIELYVVGIEYGSSSNLEACAKAGSGNKRSYYNANDASQLATILKGIATNSLSCNVELTADNPDQDRLWVYLNGQKLTLNDQDGYSVTGKTITLKGSSCNTVKTVPGTKVKAVLGCADTCTPNPALNGLSEEEALKKGVPFETVCNHIDDDCDGTLDNGCKDFCTSEICYNGKDDDCDEVVDNGCPAKRPIGADCADNAECASGACDPTTHKCVEACRPGGVVCETTDDCCQGVCSSGICSVG